MSDDSRFDPRFDPAFQRGWDGPAPEPTPVARRSAPEPERIVVTAEREAFVDESDEPDERRRVNPFLVALAALAVALLVTGLWLASLVSSGFNAQGPTSQVDWALLQILMIASPVCALLGVATGVGILFVFAVRWGEQR